MAGQHEQDQRVSGHVLRMTINVVVSHISNNAVAHPDLPKLVLGVYQALAGVGAPQVPTPVVPIKKSATPDHIVCLEDGRKLKKLKRHLRTAHGLTPEQYRARWGLPADYPMVAPNYRKMLSHLGKRLRPALRRR